jgi:hypothetical protein
MRTLKIVDAFSISQLSNTPDYAQAPAAGLEPRTVVVHHHHHHVAIVHADGTVTHREEGHVEHEILPHDPRPLSGMAPRGGPGGGGQPALTVSSTVADSSDGGPSDGWEQVGAAGPSDGWEQVGPGPDVGSVAEVAGPGREAYLSAGAILHAREPWGRDAAAAPSRDDFTFGVGGPYSTCLWVGEAYSPLHDDCKFGNGGLYSAFA